MMARIVGSLLGRGIGHEKGHPVAGAMIGAGTLFAARRLFPQRYAVIAATAAAAYLTKKWADRAEARRAAEAAHAADPKAASEGVVDVYAGIDEPDGRQIGDALPPAIPVEANGAPPPSVH